MAMPMMTWIIQLILNLMMSSSAPVKSNSSTT